MHRTRWSKSTTVTRDDTQCMQYSAHEKGTRKHLHRHSCKHTHAHTLLTSQQRQQHDQSGLAPRSTGPCCSLDSDQAGVHYGPRQHRAQTPTCSRTTSYSAQDSPAPPQHTPHCQSAHHPPHPHRHHADRHNSLHRDSETTGVSPRQRRAPVLHPRGAWRWARAAQRRVRRWSMKRKASALYVWHCWRCFGGHTLASSVTPAPSRMSTKPIAHRWTGLDTDGIDADGIDAPPSATPRPAH